ncbi:MAG: PspC domain-containing protein [Candidatus Shapirobacteria bacterium]|jgi:phage shock protein PspC (stress-responsive transcriptional regulator)|nr:PspC domain-containing protein [Candidatus Shapirobacteria bacterium]
MKNKKIYRKTEDCVVAGVCSGLADYFEIDETLVRVIFVLLAIGGGSGILIYFVLWLVIPKKGEENKKVDWQENVKEFTEDVGKKAKTVAKEIKKEIKVEKVNPEKNRGNFLGLILLLWGGILLVDKLVPALIEWDYVWPGMLIVLGGYLLLRN